MNILDNTRYEYLTISDITHTEVSFLATHFHDCTFVNCNFSGSAFDSCAFINCTFTECNISLIKIPRTEIENCMFTRCKMLGIDWTVARWKSFNPKKKVKFKIGFKQCYLNYNIFIGLHMIGVVFNECCLKDAYFETGDLEKANFTVSDLEGAVFSDTNLKEANFADAKNYNIDATKNIITKAKFSFPEAMSLVYALDIVIE